jgi:hypothetical protein
MRFQSLLCVVLFLPLAPLASAGPITYNVTVNTSSIAGTAGSLDLNFNPGPQVTQAANLQILNFASNGTLAGSPSLTGDVSGTLPGTLSFDNGTGFNDYFGGFTYGSTLSFEVMLYGPALSSPNGTAASGSTFAFSMFSDAAGTIPALTTDLVDGFAATIDVNLVGTTTVTNFSPQTSISAVPEPSSVVLIGTALGALLWFRRQRPA